MLPHGSGALCTSCVEMSALFCTTPPYKERLHMDFCLLTGLGTPGKRDDRTIFCELCLSLSHGHKGNLSLGQAVCYLPSPAQWPLTHPFAKDFKGSSKGRAQSPPPISPEKHRAFRALLHILILPIRNHDQLPLGDDRCNSLHILMPEMSTHQHIHCFVLPCLQILAG